MEKKIKVILVARIAVVFLAFYTLGYDLPYVKNPNFTDPLLTPVVLWLMIIMFAVALLVAIGSGVLSFRKHNGEKKINNINVRRINWCVIVPVIAVMLGSFLLGSTEQVRVNNRLYDDAFWLRTGDMFIYTSLTLIVLAVVLIIVSSVKSKN